MAISIRHQHPLSGILLHFPVLVRLKGIDWKFLEMVVMPWSPENAVCH